MIELAEQAGMPRLNVRRRLGRDAREDAGCTRLRPYKCAQTVLGEGRGRLDLFVRANGRQSGSAGVQFVGGRRSVNAALEWAG